MARMDSDDKMMPTRLERQFAYMQAHSEVTILGTQLQAIEWNTEQLLRPTQHPEQVTDEYIQHQRNTSEIWFLNHPTAMLRRSEVMSLGGYPKYRVAQDLGLWLKVFKAGLENPQSADRRIALPFTSESNFNGPGSSTRGIRADR